MARAKQSDDWNHTANLLAWMIRVNSADPKLKISPKDFHPFAQELGPKRKLSKEESRALLHRVFGVKTNGR